MAEISHILPPDKPKGSYSVMAARKRGTTAALDDFPTPPWATRALMERILAPKFGDTGWKMQNAWEPACGRGIMAEVLKEYFSKVYASDVHDYNGYGGSGSFVGQGPDVSYAPGPVDWVITNPPFRLASEFAERALQVAKRGVALLVRLQWLEGETRYADIVCRDPYWYVCPFIERVPMEQGRWNPEGSTATAYAWFVWGRPVRRGTNGIELKHIPPGCRKSLTMADDVARFASL